MSKYSCGGDHTVFIEEIEMEEKEVGIKWKKLRKKRTRCVKKVRRVNSIGAEV
jgi:hypothetical protein